MKQTREEILRNWNKKNDTKDNPVPSLDKKLINDYENSFPGVLQDISRETLEYFINWYNKENGVETNKVQPKKCDHNYRTETGWSVCTKCGDMY